jgi:HAD superfamily hydrolase (TIGR01490 family)
LHLALFDLDNTILVGDSDFQWGQFLIEEGLLDHETHLAKNLQYYEDYKAGTLDIYAFLKFQLKPLSEHPRAELDALHARYMERKVRPMMTEKAKALIEKHRAQGDLLAVITATNSFVTKPIAAAYGIEHLIGTTPEEIDGEFTGRVAGVPSYKDGKVTRLQQWLAELGKTMQDFEAIWFYSDSHNDLPLLLMVDHPVAVDPDPTLEAYALGRGWPIMSLR